MPLGFPEDHVHCFKGWSVPMKRCHVNKRSRSQGYDQGQYCLFKNRGPIHSEYRQMLITVVTRHLMYLAM